MIHDIEQRAPSVLTGMLSQGVLELRLNRPERLNALSRAMVSELADLVSGAADEGAKVILLRGAGRAFCAGADLKERAQMTPEERYAHNRAINAAANALAAAPLPTIAVVNGLALGGGCELALACDLRFAADTAVIGLTESRIGAIPGAGGTQRLPRLIGTARALEMMYSGEPITAQIAERWGLVNAVTSMEELDAHVLRVAEQLATRSPSATARLKKVVHGGMELSLESGLELERQAILEILGSADYAEGLAAFAEKRSPSFASLPTKKVG